MFSDNWLVEMPMETQLAGDGDFSQYSHREQTKSLFS